MELKFSLDLSSATFLTQLKRHGVGPVVLPAFTYQAETLQAETAYSAAGSPINARRKYALDRMVRRLKTAGVWNNLIGLYVVGDTESQWSINIKSPGIYNLTKVGTPVFTPNQSIKAAANTDAWNTGIPLSALNQNSAHLAIFTLTVGSGDASDAGAYQTSSGAGLSLAVRQTSGNLVARAMSPVFTGFSGIADGLGFAAVNRTGATTTKAFKHSSSRGTSTVASANLSTEASQIYLGRLNGATTISGRELGFASIGAGLTDAQMAELYGAVRTFYESQRYGDIEQYDAGFAPAAVSTDVVIYGATAAGLLAAYELKRQGKNVIVVGGWRDTPASLGGMSTGGLSYVDFHAPNSLGGLPRDVIRDASTAGGLADTSILYTSRDYRRALQKRLDPAKTGGQGVPIYYSTGVAAVAKTGARITAIKTADGRTYSAKYFYDHSYESDLMSLAGVSFAMGREAAGTSSESNNGYRGLLQSGGATEHQFKDTSGNLVNIDPYVTPGNASSGLLYNVFTLPTKTVGQADDEIQAFNFRLAVTTSAAQGVPMSSTPPVGYTKSKYEALLRWLAAVPALTMDDILNLDAIRTTGVLDINSDGGIGTDLFGRATDYAKATTYSQREAIWQDHISWILGLWYVLRYEADSRVPTALRNAALTYYWVGDHFYDNNPLDPIHFSPSLYVREMRRMKGALVWNANDVLSTDGTTPRSVKTIGIASYPMDSHHVRAYADPNSGTPRIWNEGNFFVTNSNGADDISPMPYEIITPMKAECENLLVGFGVSITHVAFGSFRMEETAKLMAQSGAMAISIALEQGNQAVQDVDYAALRSRILASADVQPQVLPQIN